MEKVLPDTRTLVRLKEQGLTDVQVAGLYGVTPQAVNKALTLVGYYSQEVSKRLIAEAVPWDVKRVRGKGSHHTTYLGKSVMAYMRVALGDEKATEAHRVAAQRLQSKLLRENKVVDYDRKTGFKLVDREERDRDLVFRWPEGRPLPRGELLVAITLVAWE